MAVKSSKKESCLTLEINNGDLTKLDEVMAKWGFKDYQGFMRFAISVFLLSEDNSISINLNGLKQDFAPAFDLIKEKAPLL